MMIHRRILAWVRDDHCDCKALGGRVVLYLDCGHSKTVQASQAPVVKTRCQECEREQTIDEAKRAGGLL